MVETFLSPVIDKLLQLMIEEAKPFNRVHRDIKSLKSELEILQPLLRDAEAKSKKNNTNDAMKAWQKQLREEADNIEDVINEYLFHIVQNNGSSGPIGSLYKAGRFVKTLKQRCHVANEIRNIKETLGKVKDRGVAYGLRPLEQGTRSEEQNVPRLRSLFMEENEVVGIDVACKELVRRLVEGSSSRSVISLVGQGGIGKTTLARRAYNEEAVKRHFDCYSWITVSQSHNTKNCLSIMMRQVSDDVEKVEEYHTIDESVSHLRQYLQTKRYVIVFDDAWRNDFWDDMKYSLPNNNKGSRVVITTRNVAVASSCNEHSYDFVQELQPWPSKMSWGLFCKKALCSFEFEGQCPQELVQISSEIIEKCQGLPLFVSAIAGLLSTKEKVEFEWRKVLDNLNEEFEKTDIPTILSLSYVDLPYHLKTCFLYFGIYPEDYAVYDCALYGLWIAEGFVSERRNKTLEEVAEEYLNELIQRNLVSFEAIPGEGRLCRVHQLKDDWILKTANDERWIQRRDESEPSFVERCRRLSIHRSAENVLNTKKDKNFRLLKVVDFENARIYHLPDEVGILLQLNYISLKYTRIETLPTTISKLRNLQYLDVRYTLVKELPIEINKLQNLRHLFAYSKSSTGLIGYMGVKIYEGVGYLHNLQTLTLVEANLVTANFAKELENLKELRWLDVSQLTTEIAKTLCVSIAKMNHLVRLCLATSTGDQVLELSNTPWSCHDLLSNISLAGRLQKLPEWFSKLRNLRLLVLLRSKLADEPIQFLKGLPNLENLRMYNAYDGEQLHFEEGGFVKLKKLRLIGMEGLKMVRIDRGALLLLEELDIYNCPVLKAIVSTEHLRSIKRLYVKF